MNFIRTRTLPSGKLFVSTDHGTWIMLDKEEYAGALKGSMTPELREEFKQLDITGMNDAKVIDDYRERYNYMFQGPSLHIMVLTKRCNLKCRYCQASAVMSNDAGLDMTEETAKKTVDFILKTPAPSVMIEFQGGEPLIRWDIIKAVVEYAQARKGGKRLSFSLVTNLTLMDEGKLDYLMEKEVGICSSFEGIKAVHDRTRIFCDGSGSFENVVAWIKKIIERQKGQPDQKRRHLNALLTITRYSLPYWKEIVDSYLALGLPNIHLRFMNNIGYAREEWGELGYTPEEFLGFWKKAVDYIIDQKLPIKERMVHLMMQKLYSRRDPGYTEMMNPCGAIISQLAYDVDGGVYTCDEGRMVADGIFKLGTVDDDFKELTTSQKACSLISASILDTLHCDTCAYKPFCGVCPVVNFLEQGTTITNIAISPRHKIYLGMYDYLLDKLSDETARKQLTGWLNPTN